METIEVILIYVAAYASLAIVIGIAVVVAVQAIVDRRRDRREDGIRRTNGVESRDNDTRSAPRQRHQRRFHAA